MCAASEPRVIPAPPPVPGPIAWVHVETDHLDTQYNFPLEIGIVVTHPTDLQRELGTYEAVVGCHVEDRLSPWARRTHEASGLLAAVRMPSAKTLACIDVEAVDAIDHACLGHAAWLPTGVCALPPSLGASRPGFHRSVLRRRLPGLHAALHHREVDVASLREVMRRFMGISEVTPRLSHRALDGARAAVATMRQFLAAVDGKSCRHPRVTGAMGHYVCDMCGSAGTFTELRGE